MLHSIQHKSNPIYILCVCKRVCASIRAYHMYMVCVAVGLEPGSSCVHTLSHVSDRPKPTALHPIIHIHLSLQKHTHTHTHTQTYTAFSLTHTHTLSLSLTHTHTPIIRKDSRRLKRRTTRKTRTSLRIETPGIPVCVCMCSSVRVCMRACLEMCVNLHTHIHIHIVRTYVYKRASERERERASGSRFWALLFMSQFVRECVYFSACVCVYTIDRNL
jgi:hypothetical protein